MMIDPGQQSRNRDAPQPATAPSSDGHKNGVTRPGRGGFAARSAKLQALRDHRHRSGRKTLVQLAKSGDLDVRQQATWGMSDRVPRGEYLFFENATFAEKGMGMPMEAPWRTEFQPGDYIFGYASSITEFTSKHSDEGASDKDKIQELATDLFQAMDGKGKSADKQSFIESLQKHPKYSGIVSDSGRDIRAPALAGLGPGAVKNNREWRIKSKGSLYWATMDQKKHVHFILDGINMDEVVNKSHTDGPPHGQDTPLGTDADKKTRTITHSELRWIYRNKVFPEVRQHVQFWLNDSCCVPPWRSNHALWAGYVPKNSPSTPGIMWELD